MQGWPEPYIYTVYVWFWPTLKILQAAALESLHMKANLHIHTHFPLLPQANGSAAGMQHLFNSGPEEPADFITEVRGDEEGLLGENDSRPDSAMHGLPLKRECVRVCLRVMCVMCV